MPSLTNTRFPNGVTNVSDNDIFEALAQPDPTKFIQYYDDFYSFHVAEWTITETNSAATEALAAGVSGWLLITNTAADNDLVALQRTYSLLSFTAGKKAFFKARFKVSDATQSDLVMGLQVIDTTPLDVTDGVYFLKADGAATVDIICRKNASTGSTSASAIATMANDTFITLAWAYDGVSKIYYAVDGTVKGALDASSSYLPDSNVTVSFAIQNGEAAAKTMTVDYIYTAFER